MLVILLDHVENIFQFSITVGLLSQTGLLSQSLTSNSSFPSMDSTAQRTMDTYMGKPQGRVTNILRRSDPIDIPPHTSRRIQPEPVTFGSIPAKRLADFEDNDMMPAENPKLQRESRWVPERTVNSPTELATILAQGCSSSLDLYPSADSYDFNLSPKKQVDQHLYVYHVGVRLAQRGKPWGFYLTSPICSVQTFESLYDDKSKGVRRVCMRPNFSTGQNEEFGAFMNHLEDVENRLKNIVYNAGENVDNWRSPIKMEVS